MKAKRNIKIPISKEERDLLRKKKVKKAQLTLSDKEAISHVLDCTQERAKEIYALSQFQSVPSIGIKFAEDLIFMGYYSLEELIGKDGAQLVEDYEAKVGYWIDPCVEDQFRLVVHYASSQDDSKNWWDFTPIRKAYRRTHGYPIDRPSTAWHEVLPIQSK